MFNRNISLFLILMILFTAEVFSVNVEVFYGTGCPHCKKEIRFLESINENNSINITFREIYNNKTNKLLFDQRITEYKPKDIGVPMTIVGDKAIVGFSEDISGQIIELIRNQSAIEKSGTAKECGLCRINENSEDDSRITMLLIIISVLLSAMIITTLSGKKKRNRKQKN